MKVLNEKALAVIVLVLVLGVPVIAPAQSCPSISDLINQAPNEPLSELEQAGIVFMREEEKLARDVYLDFYDLWGLSSFKNIADSEQQHMDSAGEIITKYGLTDPVVDDGRGKFSNADLQALYRELVSQGGQSMQAALEVGAMIEDLDLYDLARNLLTADNEDIRIVYQNLAKGSRNHLRTFTDFLTALGIDYRARYLDQDEVDRIVSEDPERGIYDADGELLCVGNNNGAGWGGKGR